MAGTFKGLSQQQIDKRLREGRGQGHGPGYKPFIYTRDVSSLGRSHRLPGSKSSRLHHLLSDLELAVFLMLDWSPKVLDIREQFPMRVDDTVRIARELGIPHATFKGTSQVLSSDFLVDFDDPDMPMVAFQAKYSNDLRKPETIERLMLEKRYWQEKGIPWRLVSEKELSGPVLTNIHWLYPANAEGDVPTDELHHYQLLFAREFERNPGMPLTAIAQRLDMAYDLEAGLALYWLRQLLARRVFMFDINLPYRKLTPADIRQNHHSAGGEADIASG